jgi:hypothetical protein
VPLQCFAPPFSISVLLGSSTANTTTGDITTRANASVAGQDSGSAALQFAVNVAPTDRFIQASATLDVTYFVSTSAWGFLPGYANASAGAFIQIDGILAMGAGLVIPVHVKQVVSLYDAHAAILSAEGSATTTTISLVATLTRLPPSFSRSGLFPNLFNVTIGLDSYAIAGGAAGAAAGATAPVTQCCVWSN